MRAVICGASGTMGRLLCEALGENVVGHISRHGVDFLHSERVQADVVLDFSHRSMILPVLAYVKKQGIPVVIGTTGHTREEKAAILAAAKEIPVFYAGNMSFGVAVLCRLAKQVAVCFPEADIEIVETHHNRKADAPSGTARMLFDAIAAVRPQATANCVRVGECKREKREIGICSIRRGNVVGIHEVIFTTDSQSITLRHEATDRKMFAQGALQAAHFILGKPPGLYTMEELLGG